MLNVNIVTESHFHVSYLSCVTVYDIMNHHDPYGSSTWRTEMGIELAWFGSRGIKMLKKVQARSFSALFVTIRYHMFTICLPVYLIIWTIFMSSCRMLSGVPGQSSKVGWAAVSLASHRCRDHRFECQEVEVQNPPLVPIFVPVKNVHDLNFFCVCFFLVKRLQWCIHRSL